MCDVSAHLRSLLGNGRELRNLADACSRDASLRREVLMLAGQLIRAAAHDRLSTLVPEEDRPADSSGAVKRLLKAVDLLEVDLGDMAGLDDTALLVCERCHRFTFETARPSGCRLPSTASLELFRDRLHPNVRNNLSDDFFCFIEFQAVGDAPASLDLERMLSDFDGPIDHYPFFVKPWVEVFKLTDRCQYAAETQLGHVVYLLHSPPTGGLIATISGKSLTEPQPESRLVPRGDYRWVNPQALVEFTLEFCRFVEQTVPAEAGSGQSKWRAGFRDPNGQMSGVRLPNVPPERDGQYSEYSEKGSHSDWHEWKHTGKDAAGRQAYEILWSIYARFGKKQKEIPFCERRRVSAELLREETVCHNT